MVNLTNKHVKVKEPQHWGCEKGSYQTCIIYRVSKSVIEGRDQVQRQDIKWASNITTILDLKN